jgi:hypothetical protein
MERPMNSVKARGISADDKKRRPPETAETVIPRRIREASDAVINRFYNRVRQQLRVYVVVRQKQFTSN